MENHEWWNKSVFYEIYMPSFMDGNGDGIGDFQGLTSRLDYLNDLGIKGIWLTPFYPSPKIDNGYDISDYYAIDTDYGSLADFEGFIDAAHTRGIRVIVDLVLNHTSSEHEWFKESRLSKDSPKRDWYIWKDEPNNWESFFGGTAWEFDEKTGQYYYHAFAKEQVDLNWANPEVKKEMFKVMEFWIHKGVDGFRLDVINFLKVTDQFTDNPFDEKKGEQVHQYDMDQDGIIGVISEISDFVHQFPGKFLVGEVGSEEIDVLKRYSGMASLDVVFNFNIGSIAKVDIKKIYNAILKTEEAYSSDQIATLFFSSHDMSRYISRFGSDEKVARLIATLMLTARGVPFIYFGDEIGMNDWVAEDISKMMDIQGVNAYKIAKDKGESHEEAFAKALEKTRDKSRTPMQWDGSTFAGFSKEASWITIPQNARTNNVACQQGNPDSMLYFHQKLIQLRNESLPLQVGEYEHLSFEADLLTYVRRYDSEKVCVLLNFSSQEIEVKVSEYLDGEAEIVLSSLRSELGVEKALVLLPYEALVLKMG